jgi:hypothetical protein
MRNIGAAIAGSDRFLIKAGGCAMLAYKSIKNNYKSLALSEGVSKLW